MAQIKVIGPEYGSAATLIGTQGAASDSFTNPRGWGITHGDMLVNAADVALIEPGGTALVLP